MLKPIEQILFNKNKPANTAAREAAIVMMIVTLDILLYKKPTTVNPKLSTELSTPEGILQRCTIEGNIVKLPNLQLSRPLYVEVANRLKLIGGKWKGGNTMGFVFPSDPTELLQQITGEKRNLKKEYQFFATPDTLANKLAYLADIKKGETILEPSAGQGAIVNAVARLFPTILVDCYELMDVNQTFLRKNKNAHLLGSDFLSSNKKYDVIIANPPFTNNQDITHIRAMYECCNAGGRIITVASKHWQISNNKKETEFRQWLNKIGAYIEEIPAGTFSESGTEIKSCIIIINK